jgi:hypothetical protein
MSSSAGTPSGPEGAVNFTKKQERAVLNAMTTKIAAVLNAGLVGVPNTAAVGEKESNPFSASQMNVLRIYFKEEIFTKYKYLNTETIVSNNWINIILDKMGVKEFIDRASLFKEIETSLINRTARDRSDLLKKVTLAAKRK